MGLPRTSIPHWRGVLGNVSQTLDDIGWISVTSPIDLVRLDNVRQLAIANGPLGTSTPNDLFVFAKGKPTSWCGLVIGSQARRPRNAPWPRTKAGRDMTFLAQFTFTDSMDILTDLPGETLLVFAQGRELSWPDDASQLQFEWYSLKECQACNAPRSPDWDFVHCWGDLVRTCDYADPQATAIIEQALQDEFGTDHLDRTAARIAVVGGSKIGGVPLDASTLPAAFGSYRFLASLATVSPRPNTLYPWTNSRSQLSFSKARADQSCLDLRDGFILDLFLERSGRTTWALRFA